MPATVSLEMVSQAGSLAEKQYGDPTECNTERLLLDGVGKELLGDIVLDYLSLLGTSTAIYEKNGDYAHSIDTSGWCRKLDAASRALCGTDDDREAYQCGQWHCHESCRQTARTSIETGQPVDRVCQGGIRTYAVPIRVHGEIVGAINFGYGDPPQESEKLKATAEKYGLSLDELREQAAAHESRPAFVIEVAKSQLALAAKLLGAIVEQKQAANETRHLNAVLEKRIRKSSTKLQVVTPQLRERSRLAWLSADVGFALTQAETLHIMLGYCAESMVRNLDAAFARIWTIDQTGEVLELQASAGLYIHLDGPHSRIPVGAYKIGLIAQERTPHLSNDVVNDPRVSDREWARREGMVAFAGYPLLVEGQLLGVMAMFARHPFTQATLEAMGAVANQIALGIRRCRAEAELEKRFRQQAAVAELGRIALVGSDLTALMQETVARTAQTLEVEYCKILKLLPGGQELLLTAGVGWKEGCVGTATVGSQPDSQAGYTLLNRDPVIVADLRTETRFSGPRLLFDHGVVSGLSTVIQVQGKPFGVLGAHTTRRRAFSQHDTDFLQAVANVLAAALERDQAAAALQQSDEQFRQAQKMEAIGRLAGGVAHDFNNLLTIITGCGALVLGDLYEGDPLRVLVEEITKAGDRAAALTRQLLAFSRKQMLAPVVLELNALVTDIEKMLRRVIGEDIDLTARLNPNLGRVKADPAQLEQILMNLVINARDAMPRGGKLTIETSNVELDTSYLCLGSETPAPTTAAPDVQPGQFVRLAVSDTGCGMDEATRTRIFEPFFTTKGPEKGTGLGLATAYGIVKQSGGHIEVVSEPGVGSTFTIYLPRSKDAVVSGKSNPGLAPASRGTETILLVEDEVGVRTVVRLVLQKNGYTVLEACHGFEAVQVCQQHSGALDLLMTDVVMPRMNGRQVAEHLVLLLPNLKVLYLSGYTDEAIVHHGILDPNTPFLQKPFTNEALLRKVREVLDHSK